MGTSQGNVANWRWEGSAMTLVINSPLMALPIIVLFDLTDSVSGTVALVHILKCLSSYEFFIVEISLPNVSSF